MHVLVLTGGPQGGKTTVKSALSNEFGDKVVFVPEAATMLLANGFPRPDRELRYSREWQDHFQAAVNAAQLSLEATWKMVAEQRKARVLICDRGVLDGAAYVEGGLPAFLARYNLDEREIHNRYQQVIHLESVSVCKPELYGKVGNDVRYETLEQAQTLEYRTREAWQNHPNWTFVAGGGGMTQVVAQVLSIISEYADREVERKFLLPDRSTWGAVLHAAETLSFRSKDRIIQGYTSDGLRLREMGHAYYMTVKSEGDVSRFEWERQIPEQVFRRLWDATKGHRLTKDRYFIPYGTHMLEVDFYYNQLEGLVTLECEFPDEAAAEAFTLPEWASSAIDVSNDPRYKNWVLATYGLPKE